MRVLHPCGGTTLVYRDLGEGIVLPEAVTFEWLQQDVVVPGGGGAGEGERGRAGRPCEADAPGSEAEGGCSASLAHTSVRVILYVDSAHSSDSAARGGGGGGGGVAGTTTGDAGDHAPGVEGAGCGGAGGWYCKEKREEAMDEVGSASTAARWYVTMETFESSSVAECHTGDGVELGRPQFLLKVVVPFDCKDERMKKKNLCDWLPFDHETLAVGPAHAKRGLTANCRLLKIGFLVQSPPSNPGGVFIHALKILGRGVGLGVAGDAAGFGGSGGGAGGGTVATDGVGYSGVDDKKTSCGGAGDGDEPPLALRDGGHEDREGVAGGEENGGAGAGAGGGAEGGAEGVSAGTPPYAEHMRVAVYRRLKHWLRKYQGRHHYHNFSYGAPVMHDASDCVEITWIPSECVTTCPTVTL